MAGALSTWALNALDAEFEITEKVVSLVESAQQEFVGKAKQIEKGIWDLGKMYADGVLYKGVEVVETEVKKYIRLKFDDFSMRWF